VESQKYRFRVLIRVHFSELLPTFALPESPAPVAGFQPQKKPPEGGLLFALPLLSQSRCRRIKVRRLFRPAVFKLGANQDILVVARAVLWERLKFGLLLFQWLDDS